METVIYKNQKIEYDLIRKDVKNINLRIHPDLSITVSANPQVEKKVIDDFVISKGAYILKSLASFKTYKSKQLSHDFVSGETIVIFGKGHILKVKKDKKNHVDFDGLKIVLYVTEPNNFKLKSNTLQRWIKTITIETIEFIFEETYEIFRKYGIERPKLKLRSMTSKWGSCQYQKGVITLNSNLILYPKECAEYVIMHEFCHLIHPNHSKKFYLFLSMQMPDWKRRKQLLEK